MSNLTEYRLTTVNALLYILDKMGGHSDFHKVFKILYFAEQKHLVKYGSPFTEDTFIAMENGPVPSMAYDIFKSLKGKGLLTEFKPIFEKDFELLNKYNVKAKSKPNLEYLSESNLKCLDQSIKENQNLSFQDLTDKSHDEAWKKAIKDNEMDLVDIAEAGDANEDMINYIKAHLENEYAEFE